MITFQKNPNKDFIILNLTDPQLGDPEWADGHVNRTILEYTLRTLIERTKPDLITISGDIAWAAYTHAYFMFAELLEEFNIPWAPVWGNHDNQNGPAHINEILETYRTYPHFTYEEGDPALGNGNYVIKIEEDGKTVEALIMMDTHNKVDYTDENGEMRTVYAPLSAAQIEWYKAQAAQLKADGCPDATMILHIPIYAYNTASRAAYKPTVDLHSLTVAQADGTDCWNEGYEDSVGVQHEVISSYPADDGAFATLKEDGLVKHVLAGHDHNNNWIIRHEGITLLYGLKLGAGCYWQPELNGGTVLKVGNNGVNAVYHEYVDVSHLLK